MTQNFTNAKIYKIRNDYNDEVYVGSTCDTLTKRYSGHKKKSKEEKYNNIPLYKAMNEIGIERFRIDLIEDYPCNDKQALRQREGHFIRQIGTLNKRIAGRTRLEYRIEHKEEKNERQREYYNENKKEQLNKINEYKQANKEKIKEQNKKYRELNAIKIKEKNREYNRLYREKKK